MTAHIPEHQLISSIAADVVVISEKDAVLFGERTNTRRDDARSTLIARFA